MLQLQKAEIFEMLGIESTTTTTSGAPQWDRDQIERVNKETTDPDIKDLTQFSFYITFFCFF